MEVLGVGVLITGESSIGKSELALELISRGHSLVADDAPEFRRIAHNTIEGNCPQLLRDFLEVRGLGVLNIRRMYGHAATRHRKVLRFIVRLELMDDFHNEPRLSNIERIRNVLGVEIAELTLPVAPGRNLAVLVEAAVRNYLLRKSGYDSGVEFESLQAQLMET
jgi:HPr kinase/phosphorylase